MFLLCEKAASVPLVPAKAVFPSIDHATRASREPVGGFWLVCQMGAEGAAPRGLLEKKVCTV